MVQVQSPLEVVVEEVQFPSGEAVEEGGQCPLEVVVAVVYLFQVLVVVVSLHPRALVVVVYLHFQDPVVEDLHVPEVVVFLLHSFLHHLVEDLVLAEEDSIFLPDLHVVDVEVA